MDSELGPQISGRQRLHLQIFRKSVAFNENRNGFTFFPLQVKRRNCHFPIPPKRRGKKNQGESDVSSYLGCGCRPPSAQLGPKGQFTYANIIIQPVAKLVLDVRTSKKKFPKNIKHRLLAICRMLEFKIHMALVNQ